MTHRHELLINNRRRPIRGVGVIARPVGADRAMPGPLHVPGGKNGKGCIL